MVFIAVYVDDILLTRNDLQEMQCLKEFPYAQFKIKDLGNLHFFLGIEIIKEATRVILTQCKFALDLIAKHDGDSFKPVLSPLLVGFKLSIEDGLPVKDPLPYRRLIGKLNYLTHTRHDISFLVQYLS